MPEGAGSRLDLIRAMSRRRKLDNFVDETRESQRNIVFPDTVRNARSIDEFLWRGSPHPSLVQSLAAWMLGLVLIGLGIEVGALAVVAASSIADVIVATILSLFTISLGIRTFRNGFPRAIKPSCKAQHHQTD